VSAEYYGLMMFAHAAPAGTRLLKAKVSPAGAIRAWATEGSDHVRRYVLINDGDHARVVSLTAVSRSARVRTETLEAPSIQARFGVTLGGRTFGRATSTGVLVGPGRSAAVRRRATECVVTVPATSAALVTVG
jgi:hypothetical protein